MELRRGTGLVKSVTLGLSVGLEGKLEPLATWCGGSQSGLVNGNHSLAHLLQRRLFIILTGGAVRLEDKKVEDYFTDKTCRTTERLVMCRIKTLVGV